MKKYIYINKVSVLLFTVFAAFATTSCSESFLDHQPDERTEITSLDDVQKLLMTSYPTANFSWIAELSSDNLLDNQTPHLPSNPNKKQVTTYYNYSEYSRFDNQLYAFEPATYATYSDYDSPGSLWEGYYSSIASCNYAIQALDAMETISDESEWKALRAEAQILRAWDHFCLVNMFSQAYKNESQSKQDVGVPYVTTPETSAQKEYDRGNVYDVYQNIQKDLEEALPSISDSYFSATKYHFNQNAAHAFAARYYLYTRQWQKVIDHANEVLGTDSASVEKMMLDYQDFDDCSYSSDYATVWQNPTQNNNLMLTVTGSLLQRRLFGYRYSLAGEKCQQVLLVRTSSLWSGYICPIQAVVAGMLFSSSTKDYGFFSAKIGEEFEYTDKLAGIGYPHIVQRTFTAAELLLERAEAKIMLGDLAGASEDLCLYWNSGFHHFSETNQEKYQSNYKMLTDQLIQTNYNRSDRVNCFENWDFTQQNVSSDYVISSEAVPYMNCLNEFRRFENVFEGLRFFDLKRWGMPYEHQMGSESTVYTMEGIDSKRAIEVPWETMSAGLESSRGAISASKPEFTIDFESLKSNN